jgi:hypothetical protein
MLGSTAQTIALVMHGNAMLRGFDVTGFWPSNSVFQFCRSVSFTESTARLFGRAVPSLSSDPNAWLQTLKEAKGLQVRRLSRHQGIISDRMSSAFVGGGSRFIIEVDHARRRSVWEDRWRLEGDPLKDQKIWAVDYVQLANRRVGRAATAPDIEGMRQALGWVLDDIIRFSRRADAPEWCVDKFQRGLSELGSGRPEPLFHVDLAPPGLLTLPAQQLLAASSHAWVFGGMGSWNDGAYGPEFGKEGDRLSDLLFKALEGSSVAAANSTHPAFMD